MSSSTARGTIVVMESQTPIKESRFPPEKIQHQHHSLAHLPSKRPQILICTFVAKIHHQNASSPTSRRRFGLGVDCRRGALPIDLKAIKQCDWRRQIYRSSGSTKASRQEDSRSHCLGTRLRQIRQHWSECACQSQRSRFKGCGHR